MTDRKLVELARAAERGDFCPMIRLVTAGDLITGRPIASRHFAEAHEAGMRAELAQWVKSTYGRKEREEKQAEFAQSVRNAWNAIAQTHEPDTPETLTLFQPVIWASGEPSGIQAPAARVRLEAITSWWVTGGQMVKGQGGGGWFVGFAAPVGD